METWIDKLQVYLVPYAIKIVAALLIFILGKWAAKLISNIMEKALMRAKTKQTLTSFAKNMVYFVILIFVCIAALNKLGVETNSVIAIIGAAGLAVGLALQGSLSNFAAGVMIVLFEPFAINDYIEAGGAVGRVKEMQIFNTIIYTDDNKKVIVPNAKVTGDKIVVHPKIPK